MSLKEMIFERYIKVITVSATILRSIRWEE